MACGYRSCAGKEVIDLGSPRFPNLALMKLSAYYKAQGASVVLGHPGSEATFVSCIFSRFRELAAERVEKFGASIGGPGWDPSITLPPEIEACRPDYSLYGITYGLGRLTAGCPGNCPWCVVPAMEGPTSRTVAHVGELVNGDFLVLLDSNILACSDWTDHFREIRERGLTVHFTQGLDIRLVHDFEAAELARLKISNLHRTMNQLYFAWDRPENEPQVLAGIDALVAAGIKPYRLRFFVLTGFSTTWEQDWHRFAVLRDRGCQPFIMTFEGGNRRLKAFARYVNRMVYKSAEWKDYERYDERQLSLAVR